MRGGLHLHQGIHQGWQRRPGEGQESQQQGGGQGQGLSPCTAREVKKPRGPRRTRALRASGGHSGSRTRTCDLVVMSHPSCQLLYPASKGVPGRCRPSLAGLIQSRFAGRLGGCISERALARENTLTRCRVRAWRRSWGLACESRAPTSDPVFELLGWLSHGSSFGGGGGLAIRSTRVMHSVTRPKVRCNRLWWRCSPRHVVVARIGSDHERRHRW